MNLKRSLALALSVLILLTVALPAAFGTDGRISGNDRYATAVAISQQGWTSAVTVVLARGDHYADALAGVPLAHKLNAPVLLTATGSLTEVTKNEILRLGASKVVILGGEDAISEAVVEELELMGRSVQRIEGDDRFETAANIAKEVNPKASTVVLANGLDFPDALAAAPYAAKAGYPILLTSPKTLAADTAAALNSMGATKVIVIGGTSAISADVFNAVSTRNPVRVSGTDRFMTAVALANYFKPVTSHMFVASGLDFPDAITGAVLAAKQGTGLLLVGGSLPAGVGDFMTGYGIMETTIFGGTKAVSAAVADQIADKLAPKGASGVAGFVDAGTTVTVAGRSTVSAANGFYKITGITAGTHTVTFAKKGHETAAATVAVTKDKVSTLNHVMGSVALKDTVVKGAVVLSTGAPATGVSVRLQVWDTDLERWVTTQTKTFDGSYEFKQKNGNWTWGQKVRVIISKSEYHTVIRETTIKTDSVNNVLDGTTLQRIKYMTIEGQVINRGLGVNNAAVTVFDEDFNVVVGPINTSGIGNDAGTFEIGCRLPTGQYWIQVNHANYAIDLASVNITEGVDVVHDVALVEGYNVTLNLSTEEHGGSFKDGNVLVELLSGGSLVDYTKSLAGGSLITMTIPQVAAGNYTLRVSGDYLKTKEFSVSVVDRAVAINNARTFTAVGVNGTITAPEVRGGAAAPCKDAVVELLDGSGNLLDTTTTDDAGYYAFGGLDRGRYNVRVSKPGYVTQTKYDLATQTPPIVETNNQVLFTTALAFVPNVGSISGYIRTAGSYLPANDSVITYYALKVINPATGSYYDAGTHMGAYTTGTVTAGKYEFAGMLPGLYTVVIRDSGKHETYVTTQTIVGGNNGTAVNYFLQSGGNAKLTLTAKRSNGNIIDPNTGRVSIEDAYGHVFTGAVDPDNADRIVFAGLSAGTYTINVNAFNTDVDLEEEITIGKGASVVDTVQCESKASLYAVNLILYGKNNADVAGKIVIGKSITNFDTASAQPILNLANGTYTAYIYANGYQEQVVTFTVNGQALNVPVIQLTAWK